MGCGPPLLEVRRQRRRGIHAGLFPQHPRLVEPPHTDSVDRRDGGLCAAALALRGDVGGLVLRHRGRRRGHLAREAVARHPPALRALARREEAQRAAGGRRGHLGHRRRPKLRCCGQALVGLRRALLPVAALRPRPPDAPHVRLQRVAGLGAARLERQVGHALRLVSQWERRLDRCRLAALDGRPGLPVWPLAAEGGLPPQVVDVGLAPLHSLHRGGPGLAGQGARELLLRGEPRAQQQQRQR
mmetsp:Transcript_77505/g.224152  ORF Transcript_77505/g.224152 Transcript_77505/m.224152 type:complete len:243 (-) Transcript_77505:358-1086(-)